MNKIIHPLDTMQYNGKFYPVFCKIEIKDGKLSITGVEGPKRNGDAWGGCGQIDSTLRDTPAKERKYAPGWTPALFKKFLDIWDTWHLNDMHPECEHQRAAGWLETASLKVTFYSYHLNSDIMTQQRELKKSNEIALLAGQEVKLSQKQIKLLSMEWSIKTSDPTPPANYVPDTIIHESNSETKTLRWVTPEEHPDGILSRPCPTCGYKYGHAWNMVELPAEVIEFLESLPETNLTPAWV